uniref:Secreted RxLR effector protein 21 n=1 Tax=Plasmopara viticola TaxID=143451 RepID=RLR21_PLAVT|nr:RecName: Full=Secreted RxLR effector protein 21; Flags: Precursor [Plasmopara viticola]
MNLSTLLLTLACISQLHGGSANQATDIMRRQLRMGKAVASLLENQHQSARELEENIMADEDNKANEVQADVSQFRVRRLRSPNYVELIELRG